MEVILKQDMPNLGYKDDIISVKAGYARNYLFAQGLAVVATPAMERQIAEEIEAEKKRQAKRQQKFEEIAQSLHKLSVTIYMKVGEKGQLFGSVTASQIAEALQEQARDLFADIGIKPQSSDIIIEEAIKSLGEHKARIKLAGEIEAEYTVCVEPEEALKEAEHKKNKKEKKAK